MAKGHKTGGRTAGTPNRKTQEVTELLASLCCNPIEGMVQLAMDPKHAPELRGRMFAELAQYIYPKRKAFDARLVDTAGDDREITVHLVPVPAAAESSPHLLPEGRQRSMGGTRN